MDFPELHSWDLTPSQAIGLQRSLRSQIDLTPVASSFDIMAGADISYNKYSTTMYASVVVIRISTGEILETQDVIAEQEFPYIPGLLSFRELPVLLIAFRRLQIIPDVVICDGQGIAHPRRLGIAAHLGLWINIPCIGCGKSRLCGTFTPPGEMRGDSSPLMDGDEQIGTVLRTRNKVGPVYVSPGSRIDFAGAVEVVLKASPKYRLPETTRQAHNRVNFLRLQATSGSADSAVSPVDEIAEILLNKEPPNSDK